MTTDLTLRPAATDPFVNTVTTVPPRRFGSDHTLPPSTGVGRPRPITTIAAALAKLLGR